MNAALWLPGCSWRGGGRLHEMGEVRRPCSSYTTTSFSLSPSPSSSSSSSSSSSLWYAPHTHKPINPHCSRTRIGECIVYSTRQRPNALLHFLGGAFVGAVPQFTYSLFMELLAKEGFLVVATPYNVTFDHAMAAHQAHTRFKECKSALSHLGCPASGLTSDDISSLPVFCVGHSNGALLQLLIGSNFLDNLPEANAVIAFNNKPATDAVPYFEQFGSLIAQLTMFRQSSCLDGAGFLSDQLKSLLEPSIPLLPGYDEESLHIVEKFIQQIPSVIDQIAEGASEFRPSPSENRENIGSLYSVKNTLLVKYAIDAIDETDLVEAVLKPRIEAITGTLLKSTLNGNHLTPCGQDIHLKAGSLYTPVDAVQQLLKRLMLADIKQTVRTVTDWFIRFCKE